MSSNNYNRGGHCLKGLIHFRFRAPGVVLVSRQKDPIQGTNSQGVEGVVDDKNKVMAKQIIAKYVRALRLRAILRLSVFAKNNKCNQAYKMF